MATGRNKAKPAVGSGTFISFSAVSSYNATNDSVDSSPVVDNVQPAYSGSDNELNLLSKKLLKKDMTTKLKAFAELRSVLAARGGEVLVEFLPHFIFLYARLSLDNQRAVREKLNVTLVDIVAIDKRALGPYMKTLIGPWYTLMADCAVEVSSAATEAFENAIPKKKRLEVLTFLSPSILIYIQSNLSHSAKSLSEALVTSEEMDERFERVISSSFAALSILMSTLGSEGNASLLRNAGGSRKENGAADVYYEDVIFSNRLFKEYLCHPSAEIRKSVFRFIEASCIHVSPAVSSFLSSKRRPAELNTLLLAVLDEKSSPLAPDMYKAFLSLLQAHQLFWHGVDVQGKFLAKLQQQLLIAPTALVHYLPLIIGVVPVEVIAIAGAFSSQVFPHKQVSVVCAFQSLLEDIFTRFALPASTFFDSSTLTTTSNDSVLQSEALLCVLDAYTLLLLRRGSGTKQETVEEDHEKQGAQAQASLTYTKKRSKKVRKADDGEDEVGEPTTPLPDLETVVDSLCSGIVRGVYTILVLNAAKRSAGNGTEDIGEGEASFAPLSRAVLRVQRASSKATAYPPGFLEPRLWQPLKQKLLTFFSEIVARVVDQEDGGGASFSLALNVVDLIVRLSCANFDSVNDLASNESIILRSAHGIEMALVEILCTALCALVQSSQLLDDNESGSLSPLLLSASWARFVIRVLELCESKKSFLDYIGPALFDGMGLATGDVQEHTGANVDKEPSIVSFLLGILSSRWVLKLLRVIDISSFSGDGAGDNAGVLKGQFGIISQALSETIVLTLRLGTHREGSRLLRYCFEANSVRALNFTLDCGVNLACVRKNSSDSDILLWLEAVAFLTLDQPAPAQLSAEVASRVTAVARDADSTSKMKFLVHCVLQNAVPGLFTAILSIWQMISADPEGDEDNHTQHTDDDDNDIIDKPDSPKISCDSDASLRKLCQATLLSVTASRIHRTASSASATPLSTVPHVLQEGGAAEAAAETAALEEILVAAFFGRNRKQIRRDSSMKKSRGSAPPDVGPDSASAVQLVLTWEDVTERILYPCQTASSDLQRTAEIVGRSISKQLGSRFHATRLRCSTSGGKDGYTRSNKNDIQYRKWARHFCGLLSLAVNECLGAWSVTDVWLVAGLGDASLWSQWSADLFSIANGHEERFEETEERFAFITRLKEFYVAVSALVEASDMWKGQGKRGDDEKSNVLSFDSLLHLAVVEDEVVVALLSCSTAAAVLATCARVTESSSSTIDGTKTSHRREALGLLEHHRSVVMDVADVCNGRLASVSTSGQTLELILDNAFVLEKFHAIILDTLRRYDRLSLVQSAVLSAWSTCTQSVGGVNRAVSAIINTEVAVLILRQQPSFNLGSEFNRGMSLNEEECNEVLPIDDKLFSQLVPASDEILSDRHMSVPWKNSVSASFVPFLCATTLYTLRNHRSPSSGTQFVTTMLRLASSSISSFSFASAGVSDENDFFSSHARYPQTLLKGLALYGIDMGGSLIAPAMTVTSTASFVSAAVSDPIDALCFGCSMLSVLIDSDRSSAWVAAPVVRYSCEVVLNSSVLTFRGRRDECLAALCRALSSILSSEPRVPARWLDQDKGDWLALTTRVLAACVDSPSAHAFIALNSNKQSDITDFSFVSCLLEGLSVAWNLLRPPQETVSEGDAKSVRSPGRTDDPAVEETIASTCRVITQDVEEWEGRGLAVALVALAATSMHGVESTGKGRGSGFDVNQDALSALCGDRIRAAAAAAISACLHRRDQAADAALMAFAVKYLVAAPQLRSHALGEGGGLSGRDSSDASSSCPLRSVVSRLLAHVATPSASIASPYFGERIYLHRYPERLAAAKVCDVWFNTVTVLLGASSSHAGIGESWDPATLGHDFAALKSEANRLHQTEEALADEVGVCEDEISALHDRSMFDKVLGDNYFRDVLFIRFGSAALQQEARSSGACYMPSKEFKRDILGSVLAWLLCLQRVDAFSAGGAGDSGAGADESSRVEWRKSIKQRCGAFLVRSGIVGEVMSFLMQVAGGDALVNHKNLAGAFQAMEPTSTLKRNSAKLMNTWDTRGDSSSRDIRRSLWNATIELRGEKDDYGNINVSRLAAYALFRTVCTFPSKIRSWWSEDCARAPKKVFSDFVRTSVSRSLVAKEIAIIRIAAHATAARAQDDGPSLVEDESREGWDDPDELQISGSVSTGEITAVYCKDDAKVEITIKMPNDYPLRNVTVECTKKLQVPESKWRRWVLQMIQLLAAQDGSVLDAVLLWKRNISKEFDGVEPCPICYSILHPKTLKLPNDQCPTCNNKFHAMCLREWFDSSGKSKCVICQQPFRL